MLLNLESMITLHEVLNYGSVQLKESDVPIEHLRTIKEKLLPSINAIRFHYGKPLIVTSGYRSQVHNKNIGGSTNSAHCTGEAVDFKDLNGDFDAWCLEHLSLLKKPYWSNAYRPMSLFIEHPEYTKGWCHLSIRPSSQTVFIPYTGGPKAKDLDKRFTKLP